MIDKAAFEAHVRAEAERKHPDAWIVADQSIIDHSDYRRTYITTRMEHEWPLVEVLQELTYAAEIEAIEWGCQCEEDHGITCGPCLSFDRADKLLFPYTTKPI